MTTKKTKTKTTKKKTTLKKKKTTTIKKQKVPLKNPRKNIREEKNKDCDSYKIEMPPLESAPLNGTKNEKVFPNALKEIVPDKKEKKDFYKGYVLPEFLYEQLIVIHEKIKDKSKTLEDTLYEIFKMYDKYITSRITRRRK